MKILVTYRIPEESFSELPAGFSYILPENDAFSCDELIERIADCDALLAIFTHPVDNRVLEAGKKLRIISNFGVGYNNIDVAYARQRGIVVCNTPDSVRFPTAEMAMGLMLSAARRIAECDRRVRTERESMWGTMKNLGYTLEGRTLGIIGLGSIGRTLARMAEAFGMRIIYHNRRSRVAGYEYADLPELLKRSDFVSIHTPLTPETRGMIGAQELALLKPTAILVNTARGAVIDEQALAGCLRERRIAGAALDVFEDEPHITEALYGLDNVVLTPHNATGTIDTRIATGREAVRNILRFFANDPINVVS